MPVYLCQPGAASASKEPWRHGVQVYERPFPLYDESCPPPPAAAAGDAGGPEQIVEVCPLPAEKEAALRRHLAHLASPAASRGSRAIVFCRVSAGGQVARGLPAATVIHGGQAALERQAAWDAFREGSVAVLVVEDDVGEQDGARARAPAASRSLLPASSFPFVNSSTIYVVFVTHQRRACESFSAPPPTHL